MADLLKHASSLLRVGYPVGLHPSRLAMPALNIEKFSIHPATGILCAMEFDPRRTIDQNTGPGSVHHYFMSRRGSCPGSHLVARYVAARAHIGAVRKLHRRGLERIAAADSTLVFSEAQAGAPPERMKPLLKI